MESHFIFYVSDQQKSSKFYEAVLAMTASLNVQGMTEFKLAPDNILGLMPSASITKLLEVKTPDTPATKETVQAELYLIVDNPEIYHQRALQNGATELSQLQKRSWGHDVAYSLDLDNHVLAFARPQK